MTPDTEAHQMSRASAAARELARRTVEIASSVGAAQAEALVMASTSALTRFANNRIHQNVLSSDTGVSIRAVQGQRVGVASTNRTDEASLRACCAEALDAARHAPEDPDFPGLPAPVPAAHSDRTAAAAGEFGPEQRARAVEEIVGESEAQGLTAAGQVSVAEETAAVANSLGVDAAMTCSSCRATILSMGPDEGSGWASFTGRDPSELAARALGDQAATLACRSARPRQLDPGTYMVVLAPDAVADMIRFLGWFGGSAKAVEEGRSFMSGHLGERVMSEAVTISDDACSPHSLGLTFDFEGVPKSRVELVEAGVLGSPVTDSYWAAKTGRPNTGHALPAPNSFGPLPLDLEMAAGDMEPEKMIASVTRGVYVTRFHYVNIEDPVPLVLTGMTRDGTFLIENGELTAPLRNLRFTQGAVEALSHVGGVSPERRVVGEEGGTLAPYLLLEAFAFTSGTA